MGQRIRSVESGHFTSGGIVSLAGILSPPGQGRIISSDIGTLGAIPLQVLDNNPKRIRAIIQCSPLSLTPFTIMVDGSNSLLYVVPGGSFQIDEDFPWTGAVQISGAPGTLYLSTEVSLL